MSWGDAAAIAGGLLAGVLSGLVGIGGGQVFVPLLTIGFGVSQVVAQGTSLVAIVPTAVVGGFTHFRQHSVDVDAALWTGAGGALGAILGALVAIHVAGPILPRVFGLVLIGSALIMWRQVSRDRPAPTAPVVPGPPA